MWIGRFSFVFRVVVLVILALVPVVTLVHRDDVGRWDVQRSAMAAPDEFSYLLMARHFQQGGGLSLEKEIGRDTFYPPGYPLLLAGWGKCFGLTAFHAHVLNAVLLAAATVLAFFLCRRLLRMIAPEGGLSARGADILALLITGIFAVNWHVLDTALLIVSEPAFMVVTFAWLLAALRWADWPENWWRTLAVAGLAMGAWAVRGAGIVCVGTTLVWTVLHAARRTPALTPGPDAGLRPAGGRSRFEGRLAALMIVLALVMSYQAALTAWSREKALLAGRESANSYVRQLLHGLLVEPPAKDDPHPWATIATAWVTHMYHLFWGHLQDYAASLVPLPRKEPEESFRSAPDAFLRIGIGWLLGLLGLLGLLWHGLRALRGRLGEKAAGGFAAIYVALYAGLYLIWPFNFARFWSPILPIMLVYVAAFIVRFSSAERRARWAPAAALLTLLLAWSAEEVTLQIGIYARRLNYVSDGLRDGAEAVMRAAPDPRQTLVTGMGDDELYALAWYLAQEPGGAPYRLRAPEPHLTTGTPERADQMLVRTADELRGRPGERLFFFSYFPDQGNHDTRDTLQSFREQRPRDSVTKFYQKGGEVGIWEIHIEPGATRTAAPGP